jgi:hypothetical protein
MRLLIRLIPLSVVAFLAFPALAYAAIAGDWELNETSGTVVADSSGNGNNGASTNISFVEPGAYTFNGTSSKITVPSSTTLNAGTSRVALSLRFKSTFAAGSGNSDWDMIKRGGYKIEIYRKKQGDQARCAFTDTGGRKLAFQAGPSLTDGAWHTVTCTRLGNTATLTVDGVNYTHTATIGSLKPGNQMWIGWGGDNTDYFHGALDYVSVNIG